MSPATGMFNMNLILASFEINLLSFNERIMDKKIINKKIKMSPASGMSS
jgi:hypothetical protein